MDTLDFATCSRGWPHNCPERGPNGLHPTSTELAWAISAHVPEGHITGSGGLYRVGDMANAMRLAGFNCPLGYSCPSGNITLKILCPAGHYCERGTNASMPCKSSWFGFGASVEERCPEGSTSDPGGILDLFLVLVVVVALLLIVLELAAGWLRWSARALAKTFAKHQSVTFAAELVGDDVQEPIEPQGAIAAAEVAASPPATLRRCRSSWYNPREMTDEGVVEGERQRGAETPSSPAITDRLLRQRTTPLMSMTPTPSGKHGTPNYVGSPSSSEGLIQQEGKKADELELGNTFVRLSLVGLNFDIGAAEVLKSLYADMHEGQLVGLLGESGSGKSTLLNILGGRANYGEISCGKEKIGVGMHAVNGTVAEPLKLNGRRFEPWRMKTLVGFVPQAHIVFKELTVYENLLYASQMRAERHMPEPLRARLIEMALELLGLQECSQFVCDPSIGERLSGGQMRRISIAIELVCNPPILLLDEPTSALDAVNTRLVIAALKDLANRGILVIASLHQPRESAFHMLEKLMLLRKGELVYAGNVKEAPAYFKSLGYYNEIGNPPHQLMNPADFYIEVCFGLIPRRGARGSLRASQKDGLHVASDDELDRLADEWRGRFAKENGPWRKMQEHVDKAITLVGGRSPNGLRKFLSAALRQSKGDSPQGSTSPESGDMKAVAENAQLRTKFEPIAELIGKVTVSSEDYAKHSELMGSLVKPITRDAWNEYFRLHFGSMLKEEVAEVLYDKALGRALKRAEAERHKGSGHHLTSSFARRRDSGLVDAHDRRRSSSIQVPKPTLADLLHEMEHWEMPKGEMPGRCLQFGVCLKRRAKKLIRKRVTVLYLKMVFITLVSSVVGGMQAATQSDNNMLAILYMLSSALFGLVISTGAIDVLGDPRERDFLAHEAASGTSASAEAIARLLLDVVLLVPISVAFAFPLQAISNMPLGGFRLLVLDLFVAWAVSCLGYVISLSVPSNATLGTAAVTFILFACFSGLMLGPSDVGSVGWLFWGNPGFLAYVEMGMQNVQELPFSLRRYVLVSRYVKKGILPQNVTLAAQWEHDPWLWQGWVRGSLLVFGLVGRLLAVIIFATREVTPSVAHLRHLVKESLRRKPRTLKEFSSRMSSTTNRVSDVTQRPSDYEEPSPQAPDSWPRRVSFDDVESAPQPQPMPMAVAVEQPAAPHVPSPIPPGMPPAIVRARRASRASASSVPVETYRL